MICCDLLWRLFETTGSINVYLLYRKLIIQ